MASPAALAPGGIGKLYGLFVEGEPGEAQLEAYLGALKGGRRNRATGAFYCAVLLEYFGSPVGSDPRVAMVAQRACALETLGSAGAVATLVQGNPEKYGGTIGEWRARAAIATHQHILRTDFNAPARPVRAVGVSKEQQRNAADAVAVAMDQLHRNWLKKQANKGVPPFPRRNCGAHSRRSWQTLPQGRR